MVITTSNGRQPADFSDVRAANLAVVLRHVATHAPCSRADIAAATGLTKATVSSLVGELIGGQLLREIGQTVRRVGRPATMIELDGAPYAWVGMEVDAGRLAVVALDPGGRRLLSWRRAVAGRAADVPGRTLAAAAALARRAVNQLSGDGRRVLGLTVAVPGSVDHDGVVRLSPELGWHDVAAREALVSALGTPEFPVTVTDSTSVAARAEHRIGSHRGTADMVYLTGATRVLAGIIAGGTPLRGGHGFAGLIGHLPAGEPDPYGDEGPAAGCGCGCGRTGCLDAVATIAALARRVDPADPLTDLEQSVEDIARRAGARDPAVLAMLDDFGRRLGSGIALVVDLVDPSVVVLGGHYARIAPWVMPPAEAAIDSRAGAPQTGRGRLVASALGYQAAATGGATGGLDIADIVRLTETVGPYRAMSGY